MATQGNTQRAADMLEAARRAREDGRLVAARALLEAARALRAEPDRLDEQNARLLLDEGRLDAALDIAGTLVDRDPTGSEARLLRADIRLAARDAAGAAADAAEAVVAARHEAAPKAILGAALLMLDQPADAAACLSEAVAQQPAHVGYRLAHARALAACGQEPAAAASLDQAIRLRPRVSALRVAAVRLAVARGEFRAALKAAQAAREDGIADACLLGLQGHAHSCLGEESAATRAYVEALQLAPEDAYVRHLVASAGFVAPPERASRDYVRVLFDGFASHFDDDLIKLDYRVPGLIRAALLAQAPHLGSPGLEEPFGPVLDLGCGTGLVALVLSDLAVGPFTGVDLSKAMLVEAAAKGLYERLIEGDVCDEVSPGENFALAVAADVLPYVGDPAPLLRAVRPRLRPEGLLILSVEALDQANPAAFQLGRRARYAHRPDALCATARAAGFRVVDGRATTLRLDRGQAVPGFVATLQLAGSGGDR